MTLPGFQPDWPAPASVRAWVTTREGGFSQGAYQSFNLAAHVEDDLLAVEANRQLLREQLGIRPAWLQQVHGIEVACADPAAVPVADASWSDQPGVACAILTAACLPALFCDRTGRRVAAAHAGWRGLVPGVLEATLASLQCPPEEALVWLGPAIGPQAFEVGPEVREAFVVAQPEADAAFVASVREGHFYADLYELARLRLRRAGVREIHGGGFCTYSDPRFYSYRRNARTGRFASLIWIAE